MHKERGRLARVSQSLKLAGGPPALLSDAEYRKGFL